MMRVAFCSLTMSSVYRFTSARLRKRNIENPSSQNDRGAAMANPPPRMRAVYKPASAITSIMTRRFSTKEYAS